MANFKVNKVKGLMTEHAEYIHDLAAVLNISQSAMSNKLRGVTEFTASEIATICKHYNVEPNLLFNLE